MLRPVTSPMRDAGVYHLGLGTWTHHADTANGITHDVIYANTCPTGYYADLLTKEYVSDEGRIPGINGPVFCDTGLLSKNSGCSCSYNVCGFQIAYCSGLPGFGVVNLNVGFQNAYTTCTLPNPLPKSPGTFDLTALPGAGLSVQGCWLVTIDLDATSQGFPINADGASCTWLATGDAATNHLFGWTFQNETNVTGVGNSYVGALVAGNGGPFAPVPACNMCDMTRWDTLTCTAQGGGPAHWPNNFSEDGWGMDTQDQFRDDTTNVTGGPLGYPAGPGCYFFGTNPVGSFHLKLFANIGCGVNHDQPECRPGIDFTTPACPCNANQPTTAGAGCNALSPGNVPTGGAKLTPSGIASLGGMTPGVNTLKLTVTGLPLAANESCYLLQGPTLGGTLTFGQGLRCVNGALKRLQIHSGSPTVVGGISSWPAPGDFQPTIQARSAQLLDPLSPGMIRHYFVQYRQSLIIAPCIFPANFNASDAQMITWIP